MLIGNIFTLLRMTREPVVRSLINIELLLEEMLIWRKGLSLLAITQIVR